MADLNPAMPMPMPPGAAPGDTGVAPAIGGPDATAPMPGPMATPEPKEGLRQAAMINVQLAIDLLTQSLPALGGTSEEGGAVLNAVKSLTKKFGKTESKTKELIPAEIMQLMKNLPQAGGGSPAAKAMMGGAPALPPGGPVPPPPGLPTPPTPV
jgi:hypothetical protein